MLHGAIDRKDDWDFREESINLLCFKPVACFKGHAVTAFFKCAVCWVHFAYATLGVGDCGIQSDPLLTLHLLKHDGYIGRGQAVLGIEYMHAQRVALRICEQYSQTQAQTSSDFFNIIISPIWR